MDKYQLWETIYYQKGKRYLEDKIEYYLQLINDETESKAHDLQLPGFEFADLSFYETQITDYHETIDIIKSVLKKCSTRHRIREYYSSRLIGGRKNSAVSSDSGEKTISKNPISINDQSNPKSGQSSGANRKTGKRVKINFSRIFFSLSIFLFVVFMAAFYFDLRPDFPEKLSMVHKSILSILFFLALIFLYIDFQKIKKYKISHNNQYYNLLAKKINCISDKSSLSGYYSGNSVKMSTSIQLGKVNTRLILNCPKKGLPDFLISTIDKPKTMLRRVFLDVFHFDSKFKIYCNDNAFMKKILCDEAINLLLNYVRINKNFEFSLTENKFCYIDYLRTVNSIQDVIFFEKILKLFGELSKIVEKRV